MRKAITIILVFAAIALYLWDGLLVFRVLTGSPQSAAQQPQDNSAIESFYPPRVIHFVEKGRSPFFAYRESPKPKASVAKVTKISDAVLKQTVALPNITISGIMWNPTNPIVMLNMPDGSSSVAKAGQTLDGGIVVKKIDKNQVTFLLGQKSFTIKQ